MSLDSPQLTVQDLSFRYPGSEQPTISGIDLTIDLGEIVLVAGATGSGKSTLLQCLAGISPSHTGGSLTGNIKCGKEDLHNWSVRQRSQYFGILLQNVETQIFTDCVWEELVFGLENWNVPQARIGDIALAALREFGLELQRNWPIDRLSAGQKQRLLLACLLSMNQPILLLDEPLAYLDAQGVNLLLQLLKTKASQGRAVLIIEHRLDVVHQICDRSYRMLDGKLQEQNLQSRIGFKEKTNALLSNLYRPKVPERDRLSNVVKTLNLSWSSYPPFPDLEVAAGETLLLKGENGCGKTTLLKLLSGLLKPTTGLIEIMGRENTSRRVVEIARDVGFVLQNPNHQLFAESVRAEFLQPGVALDVTNSLLSQLNLSDLAMKHPQALSQGQKRRLALGAVLARQPQLCLLDEIVVGQDPDSLKLMLSVLKHYTERGGTLILTDHEESVATVLNARVLELSSSGSLRVV